MSYAFGDSQVAGDRLEVVARVFEPPTSAFLDRSGADAPQLAVDLGCGPGFTTRLIAERLNPTETVGLDLSSDFLERAATGAPPGVSFRVHDLMEVPFPVGPADLLFCRYLLCHLEDPLAAMGRWGTQLRPGGLLLVEESEWIETNVDPFALYISLQETMLRSQSNDLFIGSRLADAEPPAPLAKRSSNLTEHRVSTREVATMFALNFVTWSQHPFVKRSLQTSEIESIQRDLDHLRSEGNGGETVFQLRQVVYERTG